MILFTFLINGALVALASILISPIYLAKFTNGETLGLAAFVGAGLTFAGVSGFCGMARLLLLAPWNRPRAA